MKQTILYPKVGDMFYHVHKYSDENEKWHENDVINTKSFQKRIFSVREDGLKGIVEADYEKARKQHFEDYPSRLTCFFFFTTLPDALFFKTKCSGSTQILKVRLLQGKFITCDQNIINKYQDGTQQHGQDELDYWKGNSSKDPLWEILFEGCFQVEKEIR